MRDVWSKLPIEPDIGGILQKVLYAYSIVTTKLEPPFPKEIEAITLHIDRYWKADYLGIAVIARKLRQDLDKVGTVIRRQWHDQSGENFENTLSRFEELASFFEQRDTEIRGFHMELAIPDPPRKRAGETAPEVWFSIILSEWFTRLYGRPHDEIVATILNVVFNLRPADVVSGETIRGRRRRQPEHSRGKPT